MTRAKVVRRLHPALNMIKVQRGSGGSMAALLSWNEIKARANNFSREWQAERRERAESQSFWNDFFEVFGITRRRYAQTNRPRNDTWRLLQTGSPEEQSGILATRSELVPSRIRTLKKQGQASCSASLLMIC